MKKDIVDEYLQTPTIRIFLNDYLSSLLRDRPTDPIGYTRQHLQLMDSTTTNTTKGGGHSTSQSVSVTVSPMVLPSPSPHLPPLCGLPTAPHTPHPSPYTLPTRKPAPPVSSSSTNNNTFTGVSRASALVDRSPLVYPSSLPLPPRNTPLTGTTSHVVVTTPKLASFVDRKRTEALASREFDWLKMVGLSSSPSQMPSTVGHNTTPITSEASCQTVDEDAGSSLGGGMGSTACTREFTEVPHRKSDTFDKEHEEDEEEEEYPSKPLPPPPPPSVLAKQFPTPQTHFTLINPNAPPPASTGGKKKGGSKPGSPTRSDVDLFSAEFSGEGNYGTVVKGYWSQKGATTTAASSGGDGNTNITTPIAIKVVPVVSKYSLDEVAVLKRCAVAAHALSSKNSNATSSPSSLPPSLHHRNQVSIRGASSVVMLEGPCCYDTKKNALWLPMPWMPLTLEGLIKHRQQHDRRHRNKKRGSGSPTSATPPSSPTQTKSTSMFSIEEIRSISWQLLCAVHFLSKSVGLVHLDLKPANVLLRGAAYASYADVDKASARGDIIEIGVCDFGLSQSIGGELQQLGDYSYMAPEVFWCDEMTGFTPEGYEEDADPTNAVDLAIRVSEARSRSNANNNAALSSSSSHRSRPESSSSPTSKRKGSSSSTRVADHVDMNTFQEVHDVWSVGCILLHMLDGCPISTWDSEDYFGALRDNYLTPFPRHPSRWPSDLLHLLAVMLEKDPRRRAEAYELLSTHPFFANVTP